MTVVADSKKRVTLPTKPGERFDVQMFGVDKYILTRLVTAKPRPAKATIVVKDGFSVGKSKHKINAAALQQALDEFP